YPDPLEMWRNWLSESERQWNGFLNQAMATDEFSQTMGKFMDVYLNMQKSMSEAMGRYLTAMNIPTRTDVLALGDRLAAVEERLAGVEAAVAKAATSGAKAAAGNGGPAPKPRPARTRKPQKA
ncbi:MAG: poly(R)-hydroxyalkanoic acid synthase subunit PhaE, partial [Tepidiformaceae bacterium]